LINIAAAIAHRKRQVRGQSGFPAPRLQKRPQSQGKGPARQTAYHSDFLGNKNGGALCRPNHAFSCPKILLALL
jgi:hypothetical protein